MKHITRIVVGLTLCVPLLANSASSNGIAQSGDPARWYQEDTSSPADYLATLNKEAAAAYKINLRECKTKKGKARAACEKEARDTYNQELADAKQKAKEMGR